MKRIFVVFSVGLICTALTFGGSCSCSNQLDISDSQTTGQTDGGEKNDNPSVHKHTWCAPTYNWASDYSCCTAERMCSSDVNHKETETKNSTYEVTTPATETTNGVGTYSVTFTNPAFKTQTHDIILDKLESSNQNDEAPILSENGKTVTYGLYPQTVLVDTDGFYDILNTNADLQPNGWYRYNNEYYAKVVTDPNEDFTHTKFDNGTTVSNETVYWFRCEPIEWNVLSNNDGVYCVVSSVLLDTHLYYHSSISSRTIDGQTVYANNYKYSDIRTWLNEDFYGTAFVLGNDYIQITTVDNSASTTASLDNVNVCSNTQDKVFLLSYQDYCNSSYGFSPDDNIDSKRKCKTTDWAKAKGNASDYGYYWTRSPRSDPRYAWTVTSLGKLTGNIHVSSRACVRPALSITIA